MILAQVLCAFATDKPARVIMPVNTLATYEPQLPHSMGMVARTKALRRASFMRTIRREDESYSARGRVRILAVDDHKAFREALRELIAAIPGFVLVGQAASGEEAVGAAERLAPELVVMDVVMPGMGGIAAARTILSRCPGVVVVLISVDDPTGYPGASDLGSAVACARKQDLRASELRRVWEMHRN